MDNFNKQSPNNCAQNMGKPVHKNKKKPWTVQEEELLAEIWFEHIRELRGARRNRHVYEDMKCQLQRHGCDASVLEIKSKVHNMTTRYRKEKALIGQSGGSPSSWSLFHKVHSILGSFKINNVENLVEESIEDVDIYNSMHVEMLEEYEDELGLDHSDSLSSNPTISVQSTPVAEKKRKTNFQNELLKRFDKMEEKIEQQTAELKEMDQKNYNLEVKKTEFMERFVKSSEEFKNAFVNYLKN